VKICDRVWIGFDVTILEGGDDRRGAVVGAASVVTKDAPPYTVSRVCRHASIRVLDADKQ